MMRALSNPNIAIATARPYANTFQERGYPANSHLVEAMSTCVQPREVNRVSAHSRTQFIYGATGVVEIRTPRGVRLLSPQRALWLPAGDPYQMQAHGLVDLRVLYIRGDERIAALPSEERVVMVSGLLRELVIRVSELPVDYDENGQPGRIVDLLFSEMRCSVGTQIYMPVLQDRRLIELEGLLRSDPGNDRSLEQWAEHLHVSGRTLTRLFLKETGSNFSTWRQNLRIHLAQPRLASGEPSCAAFWYQSRAVAGSGVMLRMSWVPSTRGS